MDNETRREVTQWLLKGQRDLDVADLLSKNKPSYLDVAAYHCQQAAEKALKGYLTAQDINFPKSHDLVFLLGLALETEARFRQWQPLAETLTPYATMFRYPGPTGEPPREEITGIIAQVDAFVRFVRELLINT